MSQDQTDTSDPVKEVKKPGIEATAPPAPQGDGHSPLAAISEEILQEKRRTPGLKLFDFLLYPGFTNVGVFGISVGATYLTARGGDRNAAGQLMYGKFGQWFQNRGDWMIRQFKKVGMSHNQADMWKMVFFSFFDGSLLAPVVKLFEDRRECIAEAIDEKLGTKPQDLSVYKAEPKQTWLSVLLGRFVTAAIVVPTAVTLNKTGLNDKLFNNPGKRMGDWLATKPGVQKFFGSLDVKELSRVSLFEAFYTSVCTAGLYFNSRFIARMVGKNEKPKEGKAPVPAPAACEIPASPETAPAESAHDHHSIASCFPHPHQPVSKPKAHEELKHARPSSAKKYASYQEKYLDEIPAQTAFAAV